MARLEGSDAPSQITERRGTFLVLSFAVLAGFLLLGVLFWYLVLPRFEQYGRFYATLLTVVIAGGAVFFLVWYALLIGAVVSQRIYLAICLRRGSNLFVMLFPAVARLARSFGISRDRLGHSFIEVSNRLAIRCALRGACSLSFPAASPGSSRKRFSASAPNSRA
ncbi:MAG: hypothetical protein MZU95_00585 [Desulfomicrobium escambiense]|nr:hypothetical protein [Desulfomicrobium escambiense]